MRPPRARIGSRRAAVGDVTRTSRRVLSFFLDWRLRIRLRTPAFGRR